MPLKKINAALGLLSIAAMLLHIGYTVFAYLAFYYDPMLKLLTAIPFMVLACLHAICGMFMGHYYGLAKYYERIGNAAMMKRAMSLSLWIPVVIHGFYDFCASVNNEYMGTVWLIFIIIVDIIAIRSVKRYSESDTPL